MSGDQLTASEILVTCPSCESEFPLATALAQKLHDEWQKESDRAVINLKGQHAKALAELEKQKLKEIADASSAAVQEALKAQSKETNDLTRQVDELTGQVEELQTQELELRARERELKRKEKAFQTELSRKLEEQETGLRKVITEELSEESDKELRKRDHLIDQMKQKIGDLERQAKQGSQQLQGDAAEITLEQRLREAFPKDRVERVGKGQSGADLLLYVSDSRGVERGLIYIECKDTKQWQAAWITKMQEDCNNHGAHLGVIVSAVLPKGVSNADFREGVWMCDPGRALLVIRPLREMVLQVSDARQALVGLEDKQSEMYAYATSPEFKSNVLNPLKALAEMSQGIEKEKKAFTAVWKTREKQINKAARGILDLIGNVRGIAGKDAMPELDTMDMLAIEAAAEFAIAELPIPSLPDTQPEA